MSSVFPNPFFPNVPNLPGVPQVSRLFGNATLTGIITTQAQVNAVIIAATAAPRVWGVFPAATPSTTTPPTGVTNPEAIYNAVPFGSIVNQYRNIGSSSDTDAAISPDSIREFDMRAGWRISNFPIEQGAFTSYNKTIEPQEFSFRMVKTGSVTDRQSFLNDVDAVASSTDFYTVVTPERSYQNCCGARYEVMRHGAPDANIVTVDIFFQQILQATVVDPDAQTLPDTSNAAPPSAIPSFSAGQVAPIIPATTLAPTLLGAPFI